MTHYEVFLANSTSVAHLQLWRAGKLRYTCRDLYQHLLAAHLAMLIIHVVYMLQAQALIPTASHKH